MLRQRLAQPSEPGWSSQIAFPFTRLGEPGVFNVAADRAVLGIEVRPIPEHAVGPLSDEVREISDRHGGDVRVVAAENAVACDPANPYLKGLLKAIRQATSNQPILGRKLAATSARFAPGGQGVVWGQSGIGPHAADERHYIPSIEPYYRTLEAMAAQASS